MISCPQLPAGRICGLPAEVLRRVVLDSTDGPVEHLQTRCLAGHALLFPAAMLEAAR